MTPGSSDVAALARRGTAVAAVVAAAAAGLTACAAVALSPVGAWLGRILMWSGAATLVWDAASSGVRAVRRRVRP